MEFKNVASEENETQSALHIQETEAGVVAQDVTAPVSYTHLDVYKRQEAMNPRRPMSTP